jgi:hypothetical protein
MTESARAVERTYLLLTALTTLAASLIWIHTAAKGELVPDVAGELDLITTPVPVEDTRRQLNLDERILKWTN